MKETGIVLYFSQHTMKLLPRSVSVTLDVWKRCGRVLLFTHNTISAAIADFICTTQCTRSTTFSWNLTKMERETRSREQDYI